ncbi:PREDICTED: uncharacterized protein LOC107349592 [Acropora digitifera]|uniref:uncharacterized protein LOC107349592 n=1 Tax=Acropora digitifera TaxID=70779 RepID=UPI00077AD5C5|nr:PREDICTED: uncharacterized protein LOC107349592 [Acropora digitifera]
MPSRTEGFGLAALEALSAGLPVLVSGNSGIGKALEKVPYGSNSVVNLEFNNEDSKKWAEAIKAVCRKEREVRLKEAVFLRQNYAEKYQWEGQCSTLVERMYEMIKETSTVPDEAVAEVNLGGQGSGSVSEGVFHPDLTTMQQQIVGDVVTSGRENDIQRKRPSHPIVTSNERQRQNASAGWGGTHDLLKTSTVQHQAVAANYLGSQGPSAIPETVQQHSLDAVVPSCSGNGRQGVRQEGSGDQHLSLREYGVAGGKKKELSQPSPDDKKPPQLSFKQKKTGDVPKFTKTWSDDHLPIDILLLAAESCDFLSCFSFLDQPFKCFKREIGYVYFGRMGDVSDQEKLKVALINGSKGAAALGGSLTVVLNAVKVLQPKAVFSVGTCISLGLEKARMGDVVISSKLSTAEGFITPGSPLLGNLVRDAPYGWNAPLKNPEDWEVKVHCSRDILSQSLTEKCQHMNVREQYPKAVAIETEGEGVYAAAYDANIEWRH